MRHLVPALALLTALPAAAAERSGDPLRPLLDCRYRDGFAAVDRARLPEKVRERSVVTELGPKNVSLLDGYRAVLAYPSAAYFANLKIERSQPERYAADKEAILSSMRRMAFGDPHNPLQLRNETRAGIEIHGLDQPDLSAAGPIALYSLFDDQRQWITTIFFLNQKPGSGGQAFRNLEQFRQQRDRMIEDYLGCMAKQK
ncbi:hypothetical protein [Chitinimonas lacunae]|uniref:Uncharacterized protein n=1 Tax=Chitinimonas lacunae TaxID=1963018 RepID=A0ABV8MVJ0_9NEIS